MDEPIVIPKPTMVGLKAVLKYLQPYKREFLLLGFLGIISAVANGFVPLVVGRFFDSLITASTSPVHIPYLPWTLAPWLFFILLWVGLQLIANGIDYIMATRTNYLSEKSYTSFLSQSFGHMISLPVSFFKQARRILFQRRRHCTYGAVFCSHKNSS
jgi:ABC-type multidrug transport system fused ATPase/permease subunit